MQSEKWLKSLYDANYRTLYRLAAHLLAANIGSTDDVQDVLQEVFLLAAQEKIYRRAKPETWLIVTTRNICNNYAVSCGRKI